MNEIAAIIDTAINEPGVQERFGFALLVFRLGDHSSEEDRMNYISNARREDMLAAMKEFIARAEGRYHAP